MLSLKRLISSYKDHWPDGFNPKINGIRSFFPNGYTGSIRPLRNYIFYSYIRIGSDEDIPVDLWVMADGYGRWFFSWSFTFPPPWTGIYDPIDIGNDPNENVCEAGFVFRFSNDGNGHGYVDRSHPTYNQKSCSSGRDQWIADHWIEIFSTGKKVNVGIAVPNPLLFSRVWRSAGFGENQFIQLNGNNVDCDGSLTGSNLFPYANNKIDLYPDLYITNAFATLHTRDFLSGIEEYNAAQQKALLQKRLKAIQDTLIYYQVDIEFIQKVYNVVASANFKNIWKDAITTANYSIATINAKNDNTPVPNYNQYGQFSVLITSNQILLGLIGAGNAYLGTNNSLNTIQDLVTTLNNKVDGPWDDLGKIIFEQLLEKAVEQAIEGLRNINWVYDGPVEEPQPYDNNPDLDGGAPPGGLKDFDGGTLNLGPDNGIDDPAENPYEDAPEVLAVTDGQGTDDPYPDIGGVDNPEIDPEVDES